MVQENVPAGGSIGVESGPDFRDYPFFGESFSHHVALAVPKDASLWPRTDIGRFTADFQNSDYLFLSQSMSSPMAGPAFDQFDLLSSDGIQTLWVRKALRTSNGCDGDRWPYSEIIESSSPVVCPQFPILPSRAAGGDATTIFLRGGNFVPAIAPGPSGVFAFHLLIRKAAAVELSIQMLPRGQNGRQTLQLEISGAESQPQFFSGVFSKKTILQFSVLLHRGTYKVGLGLAPGSTAASVLKIKLGVP
jgi:hypothetical protein